MILGRIKLWLGAAMAGLVAVLAAWVAILRNRAVRAENRGLSEYQSTRKAMDDANETVGSDPAVLRDWLRERGKQPGDL